MLIDIDLLFQRQKILKISYRIAGKFGEFTVMSVWRGKVWRMDRFSHKVIIISKNLDGFSLANHGRFAKFSSPAIRFFKSLRFWARFQDFWVRFQLIFEFLIRF